MRSKYLLVGVVVAVLFSVTATAIVLAGNLYPANPPASTSSYTLEDIYNRLNAGTAGSESTFTEPTSGPGTGTGHTLDQVMAKAPAADNTNGVQPDEVLTGKTYWSLRSTGWGTQTGSGILATGVATDSDVLSGVTYSSASGASTGTIATQSLSAANSTVNAGYYTATTLAAVDSDLATGNIRSGVTIFGVDGTLTGGNTYTAGVPKTGQTTAYLPGNRDDGDLEKGVAWPSPRFTDNFNGTVTDNLTGLIWLENANCDDTKYWASALTWANGLYDGCASCGGTNEDCGLTDGSSPADWRLPNMRELYSLIDFGQDSPALPSGGHPFDNVQSDLYWSSTTYASNDGDAWYVDLSEGFVSWDGKTTYAYYVWPVRGGQ